MTIGLKRHYPARGRVSAGWRPGSGFNNAVPSMVGSLEVVRSGRGWDPLMGRRLGPSADEQRSRLCARARASCQWRQLANYTGSKCEFSLWCGAKKHHAVLFLSDDGNDNQIFSSSASYHLSIHIL